MFLKVWHRFFSTKRPFKLTAAGWVFILYTIGVGAGAINTGNNLLYLVFGVFLGLLLASGFLSDLSLWGLSVEWTFPSSVEAGQPASIFLHVTNHKKWIPSLSINVEMEGTLRGKPVFLKVYIPHISSFESATARQEFIPNERGWFKLKNVRFFTRYPFGLLEKFWRLRREEQKIAEGSVGNPGQGMFVTPALLSLQMSDLAPALLWEEHTTATNARGDSSTLYGLREFVPSDNPRRIHWKASAKRSLAVAMPAAPWLVREMEREQKMDVLLRCPESKRVLGWDPIEMERFVSFVASALAVLAGKGYSTHLLIEEFAVRDSTEFLSLWNPQASLDSVVLSYVELFDPARFGNSVSAVDALEVYRTWKERAQ